MAESSCFLSQNALLMIVGYFSTFLITPENCDWGYDFRVSTFSGDAL
jgi:hypothetical protein